MKHYLDNASTRRGFLKAGGMGAVASLGLPGLLTAANLHAVAPAPAGAGTAPAPGEGSTVRAEIEKANTDMIAQFCEAWATRDANKIGEYFAEDAIFRMNETAQPAEGREVIVKRLRAFLGMAKTARFDIVKSHAIGNIVFNERHDRFLMAGKEADYHMCGVFFIRDLKIVEWWDYTMPKPPAANP